MAAMYPRIIREFEDDDEPMELMIMDMDNEVRRNVVKDMDQAINIVRRMGG